MAQASCLLIALLLFAPLNIAWSALNHGPLAVPFFRSPQSLFKSGEAPRADLEKKQKSQEFHHTYQVLWNNKSYWLENEQLIREINCASLALITENTELFESPLNSSPRLGSLPLDQEVEILGLSSYWGHVKVKGSGKLGWIPQAKLKIKNDDTGLFVNLIDSFLRKLPSHDASVITTIPKAQRLKILGYDNGFLKTQYLDYVGYVDLSHLVSRADFAVWAYHSNKRWIPVLYRQNEFLLTADNKKLSLDEFTAFAGNPAKGVVLNNDDNAPPVRSYVKIIQSEAHHWALSLVSGHGLVWWKKDSPLKKNIEPAEEVMPAEDLLKRPIFSLALEGSRKVKGLVSSRGIYRTEDGLKWIKIKQFGEQDLPVSVHPNGYWFVGSYKSSDRGRTFEPFIRWDHLAQLIESHLGRHPREIRLQKLESLPLDQMQVLVDTSPGRVQLRYHILNSSWSVLK